MGLLLRLFGMASIQTWVLVGGLILVGTNAITAIKVAHYVRTGYENVSLKNEVKYVERERKVAVLDQQTLSKALAKQKQEFEAQAENERLVNDIFRQHEKDNVAWCELNADELRVWNDQNRRAVVVDDSEAKSKPVVPTPASGNGGKDSRPLD